MKFEYLDKAELMALNVLGLAVQLMEEMKKDLEEKSAEGGDNGDLDILGVGGAGSSMNYKGGMESAGGGGLDIDNQMIMMESSDNINNGLPARPSGEMTQ